MTHETTAEWFARMTSRDGILTEMASGNARGLPASAARTKLRRDGLIESYRSRNWHATGVWWRLTEAGRALIQLETQGTE